MMKIFVYFVGLLVMNECTGARINQNNVGQLQPRMSRISRLLMGAPSVVINIEHINVDRPRELNVQIAHKDIKADISPLNDTSPDVSTNITRKTVRQNDKFFKNFYKDPLVKNEESKIVESDKKERKNITYFIHKLLNKRDSSFREKIAHFKNEIKPTEQDKSKVIFNRIPLTISDYEEMKNNTSKTNKNVFEEYHSVTNNKMCDNETQGEIGSMDYQRVSRNIHGLVDMELFQPLELSQINYERTQNESLVDTIKETELETGINMTNNDTEKDNDIGQMIANNDLDKTNLDKTDNETKDTLTKPNKTDDRFKPCNVGIHKSLFAGQNKTDNMTGKLRHAPTDTAELNDCETARQFLTNNCNEDNSKINETHSLEELDDFFQLQHNDMKVEIKNVTTENCCSGNHILDILKMLDRIFSAIDEKRRIFFFQARHLKTPQDSWRFKIKKHVVILTNSEIHRITKHGFESYHNHIDGFELFECKIFQRCEGEYGTNEKREERKKRRKEERKKKKEERRSGKSLETNSKLH